jgi:hypothetical protein
MVGYNELTKAINVYREKGNPKFICEKNHEKYEQM